MGKTDVLSTKENYQANGLAEEPSMAEAERLLKDAVKSNPGPWEQHSRYVAACARSIAKLCQDIDAERAYIYGLLHDIGRKFGIRYLAHVYDGYHYLMDLGYPNAARIALTHSFNLKKITDYIGEFDLPEVAQEEIQTQNRSRYKIIKHFLYGISFILIINRIILQDGKEMLHINGMIIFGFVRRRILHFI